MELPSHAKEQYAMQQNKQELYRGDTMTHLLLYNEPSFLEIEEKWVDILLEAE